MNKSLAIVVHDLNSTSDFSVSKQLLWLGPLKVEDYVAIPIFEAKNYEELMLLIAQYEIENLILSHTKLSELVSGSTIDAIAYNMWQMNFVAGRCKVLFLPDNEDVEWLKLEPALDRYEEIL